MIPPADVAWAHAAVRRGAWPTLAAMLICHFDYVSPAAAVAVLRLQAIADEGGSVRFAGLDVLGLEVAIPPTLDQLAAIDRHRDAAAALGLVLRRPTRRPPTLAAHLVGEHADAVGLGAAWRASALHGYWERDVDLHDTPSLVELAVEVGLDGLQVASLVADRDARVGLRRRNLELRGRGIGDVPVLEVDGTLIPADIPLEDLRRLAAW